MNSDDDRTLEQLLADTADARVRLRAGSAADQPPAHLDEAILAASRRAVAAGPVLVRRSSVRRWQVPLAAAAVVVLATSVGLLTLQERGHEKLLDQGPAAALAPTPEPEMKREIGPRVEEPVLASRANPMHPEASRNAPAELEAPMAKLQSRPDFVRDETETSERSRESGSERPAPAAPAAPTAGAGVMAEMDAAPVQQPAPNVVQEETQPAKAAQEAAPAPDASSKDVAPARRTKSESVLGRQPLPKQRALDMAADPRTTQLESIRKRWEAGDHSGAREALAAFLRQNPGYRLPAGYPVPPPEGEPAQERPSEDR